MSQSGTEAVSTPDGVFKEAEKVTGEKHFYADKGSYFKLKVIWKILIVH